jgi:hypothetical protein
MALLRSEFPATIHWRAADIRHELSRLHTVLARTFPQNSRAVQESVNAKADAISTLTGTGPALTAATLTGGTVVEATVVTALSGVSDGSLDITVDGVVKNLTGLNFTTVTNLATIAAVIDGALTGAVASAGASEIIITSSTTGYTSTITETSDPGVGTYVGDTLKLETGLGATVVQGQYATASTGVQEHLYPEFRDFNRAYKIAVDFAIAHNASSVVLTAIAEQIQYALGEFGWTYA